MTKFFAFCVFIGLAGLAFGSTPVQAAEPLVASDGVQYELAAPAPRPVVRLQPGESRTIHPGECIPGEKVGWLHEKSICITPKKVTATEAKISESGGIPSDIIRLRLQPLYALLAMILVLIAIVFLLITRVFIWWSGDEGNVTSVITGVVTIIVGGLAAIVVAIATINASDIAAYFAAFGAFAMACIFTTNTANKSIWKSYGPAGLFEALMAIHLYLVL